MKKLLLAIPIALLFIGCSRSEMQDLAPEKAVVKHPVTFKVNDFAITDRVTLANGKTTQATNEPVANVAKKILYRIYTHVGVVSEIDQDRSDADFGIIKDELPTGQYKALIIASNAPTIFAAKASSYDYFTATWGVTDQWEDTFANTFDLTVGTTAMSQNITLAREVGALEVNIEDAIPANVAKINITYLQDERARSIYGFGFNPAGTTRSFTIDQSEVGTKGKKLLMYIGNYRMATPYVELKAYDSGDKLIAQKSIPNIKVERNQKTILTGKLFITTATSSLTANTDWLTTDETVNF